MTKRVLSLVVVGIIALIVITLAVQRGGWMEPAAECKRLLSDADKAMASHEYDHAEQILLAAQALAKKNGAQDLANSSQEKLAAAYMGEKRPGKAAECLERLLPDYQIEASKAEIGPEKDHSQHQMVETLNQLAAALDEDGKADAAIALYKKYLPIAAKDLAGTSLQNEIEAKCLVLLRKHERTEEALKSQEEFESSHCTLTEAKSHITAGMVLLAKGQNDAAESEFVIAKLAGQRFQNTALLSDGNRWLGFLYLDKGRLSEAERYFSEVLDANGHNSNLGVVASSKFGLGLIFQLQGKSEQAKRMISEARSSNLEHCLQTVPMNLEILSRERKHQESNIVSCIDMFWTPELGQANPDFSDVMAMLAVRLKGGKVAEKILNNELAVRKRANPVDKHKVLQVLANLSKLRDTLSDKAGALGYLNAAYEMAPTTADKCAALIAMGRILSAQHKFQQSDALFDRALAIMHKEKGDDVEYASLLEQVASDASVRMRYQKSCDYYNRSLEIRRKNGSRSFEYSYVLCQLATQLTGLKNYKDSSDCLKEALEKFYIMKRPDRELASLNEQIGTLAIAQMHFREAVYFFDHALGLLGKDEKSNALERASILRKLAQIATGEMRYADSEKFYSRATALIETENGVQSPEYLAVLRETARYYDGIFQHVKAREIFEKIEKITLTLAGENSPEMAEVCFELGTNAQQQGNFAKSISDFQRALKIRQGLVRQEASAMASLYASLASSEYSEHDEKAGNDHLAKAKSYASTCAMSTPPLLDPWLNLVSIDLAVCGSEQWLPMEQQCRKIIAEQKSSHIEAPQVASAQNGLFHILALQKKYPEAIKVALDKLTTFDRKTASDQIVGKTDIILLMDCQGEFAKTQQLFSEAKETVEYKPFCTKDKSMTLHLAQFVHSSLLQQPTESKAAYLRAEEDWRLCRNYNDYMHMLWMAAVLKSANHAPEAKMLEALAMQLSK